MKSRNGYFLLEVVVSMGILSLVVTSLMTSLQSAQANIQQIRFRQIGLLQCESALEEIHRAWELNPTATNSYLITDGSFVVLASDTLIPKADNVIGSPEVGYRARFQETGGAVGDWHPALAWTPNGAPPPAGMLIVEARAFTGADPDTSSIATLSALFAVVF
ncbi:MAG: hypothetical protein A2W80_18190 [Candidatus Riflebacteria bacterium GWC2_50_8]|nr:MAG: hypothetical protein A2W80_18190 [Candidatus Riflebacteria bacterium GWC2_50_8]